ncbi:MAG TPA: hypothetical protein VIW29_19360 [Polyangiaceae bacterium]
MLRRLKPSRACACACSSLLVWLAGCGYQSIYGGSPAHRYEVTAGRSATASFEAVQAAVAGVRSELGAAEALGSGFPRVVVEVVRVDERSIGVREGEGPTPLARGAEIVVVGRAQVLDAPEAPPSIDTGDMSRTAQYAAGSTPTADAASRSRAVRDASRALGHALGRAVLGMPEPAAD